MRIKSLNLLSALLISFALALTSCSSSTGDSTTKGLASIVGIYEGSDDYGVRGIDEWYLEIDSEGYLTTYDYLGDSFDLGANCYWIFLKFDQLTHISGNVYSSLGLGTVTIFNNSKGGITMSTTEYPDNDIVLSEITDLLSSDLLAGDCSEDIRSSSPTNNMILKDSKGNNFPSMQ
jgi:hypothetical protein